MIYKILRRHEWDAAQARGVFAGSPDDARDGFIHFSAARQTRATFAKYFAGEPNALLLAVDENKLGPALRWETSRGGDHFPHLYAPLQFDAVESVDDIRLDSDGHAIFPPEIP